MKKKFFTIILILCLVVPGLAACFGGEISSGNGNSNMPALILKTDNFLTTSDNKNYELTLALTQSYTLNVSLGDYTGKDYYIVYDKLESSADYFTIDENNVVTASNQATVGKIAYLYLKLQKQGSSKVYERKTIKITFSARVIDNPQVTAKFTALDGNVNVTSSQSAYYGYDYVFYIPMAGKLYQMPQVEIENWDGEYELEFNVDTDENSLILQYERDAIYFMANPEKNQYVKKYIYIDVKDKDTHELVRSLICYVSYTFDDEDVFQIFYGNHNEQIRNGETLYVEKTQNQIQFVAYYNHDRINALSSALKVSIDNGEVVSIDTAAFNSKLERVFKFKKVGSASIILTYGQDTLQEKSITITIVVIDQKTLTEINVPLGADAFTVVGNSVYVSGKIYAVYAVGAPEAINGSDDLLVEVTDIDSNTKQVTLTYTYRGVTQTAVFNVPVVKTGLQKTDLTQNYQTYWNANGVIATPTEGDVRILAVPVWFTDSNEFINDEKNQKQQIINDLNISLFGNQDEIAWRSLKTYYLEESLGRMQINGQVTPWYECGHESIYYSDKDSQITTLCNDAVAWYLNQSGKTVADYDGNSDGKIDHVILYYGANYHCFRNGYAVSSAWCRRTNQTTFSNYSWISVMDMYRRAGLKATTTQLGEENLSGRYGLDCRTTIHEFGHALGLYDVYDTNQLATIPTGFNMQSNDDGAHDPYNVMALGWAKPYVFDSSDTTLADEIDITINDFQASGDVILLTSNWDDDKQIFDEYILLELYTPTGLNTYDAIRTGYADCVGIRIWHVNAVVDSLTKKHAYTNNSAETNFDLLHFIRNNAECAYHATDTLSQNNLFVTGDTFDMNTYKSQFYRADGKLDNGSDLGWSVEVISINQNTSNNATAQIKLIKNI